MYNLTVVANVTNSSSSNPISNMTFPMQQHQPISNYNICNYLNYNRIHHVSNYKKSNVINRKTRINVSSEVMVSGNDENKQNPDDLNQPIIEVIEDNDLKEVEHVPLAVTSTSGIQEVAAVTILPEEEKSDFKIQNLFQDQGLWCLAIFSISNLHYYLISYCLPSLIPFVRMDMNLSDTQAAVLSTIYVVTYAVCQLPSGYIADKMSRPQLLAGGVFFWSILTSAVARASGYKDIILLRASCAAAQSLQNPISYGMLPEFFKKNKTTALSIYNTAIYIGRALSFGLVFILMRLGLNQSDITKIIPLEQLDLDKMSILYTRGNSVTVMPRYDYDLQNIVVHASWRDIMFWVGATGIVISLFMYFTVKETRTTDKYKDNIQLESYNIETLDEKNKNKSVDNREILKENLNANSEAQNIPKTKLSLFQITKKLLSTDTFLLTTLGGSFNDMSLYALVAFHPTFYERVYHMPSDLYSTYLAAIIPISGIIGGIGGGLFADQISKSGNRYLITFGTTFISAPLIYISLHAPNYEASFLYFLIGCTLAECYRSSATIMINEIADPQIASTAISLHLATRNLVGSIGPVAIAMLEHSLPFDRAMDLVPVCYLVSSVAFLLAEWKIKKKRQLDSQKVLV